jgi:DNA adenine methylase
MTADLNSPLKWHGGKRYMIKPILKLMPKHMVYVEPFFGSGKVLFARNPDDPDLWAGDTSSTRGVCEIANDIDGRLMNFFRVLADPELFERFRRIVEATPFGRPVWEEAGRHLDDPDPVRGAAAFFVWARQCLAGRLGSFTGVTTGRTRGGRNAEVNAWLGAVEGLRAVHERLWGRVLIECRPAVEVIRKYDGPHVLFYVDPPYLPGTRAAPDVYAHEMTEAQHRELLDLLCSVKGKAILSGYANELYDTALAGWSRHTFDKANHAAGGRSKRRMLECVWCNFPNTECRPASRSPRRATWPGGPTDVRPVAGRPRRACNHVGPGPGGGNRLAPRGASELDAAGGPGERAMSAPAPPAGDLSALDDVELELFQERAAIREFEAGLPRAQAEQLALADVLGQRGFDHDY